MPAQLKAVTYAADAADAGDASTASAKPLYTPRASAQKALVGVDVFVHIRDVSADYLAGRLQTLAQQPSATGFQLQMITNRGVKVWPGGFPETFCTDHWRCRFMGHSTQRDTVVAHADIIRLLQNLQNDGVDFIKTENLCTFDGEAGFALGQGQ